MYLCKIFGFVLILLSIVFLGLQYNALEIEASGVKSLALILLTVLYIIRVKNKHILFLMFLVVFTIAEILNYMTWVRNLEIDPNFDYFYYIGNGLYILSYVFLISRILGVMNVPKVISRFPFQTLLLLILSVFVVYLVTETTRQELGSQEYALELSYNAIIMLLVSISLLNYMTKDDKKSMNLLIGSICVVFSEILQLAYFYVANFNFLNVLCSLFLVFAFIFYYLQSEMNYREIKEYNMIPTDLKA